jgi:hypothetical protein
MCANGNEIAEDTQGRAVWSTLSVNLALCIQNILLRGDIIWLQNGRWAWTQDFKTKFLYKSRYFRNKDVKYSQQSLSPDLWFWIFMTNTIDIHGKEEVFGLSEWLGDQISFPFCAKQLNNQPHGNGKQFLTWNVVLTSRYSMAAFDRQLIQTNPQQSALSIKLSTITCLSQSKYQILCTE